MLAIKIELHPYGDEASAKNIGNVLIWNKGGTRTHGNYGVAVLPEGMEVKEGRDHVRMGDMSRFVSTGEVLDYPRLDLPVEELLTRALLSCDYGDRGNETHVR